MLTSKRLIIFAAGLLLLTACAVVNGGFVLPDRHPSAADLGEPPKNCLNCHEARGDGFAYDRYVHTTYFAEEHRQSAAQNSQVCGMCHQQSFCNDCHATDIELKPSIKNQTETYRRTPHRGDFLTRHQIEGRIDPTPCFRCHGNPRTAQTCVACHG